MYVDELKELKKSDRPESALSDEPNKSFTTDEDIDRLRAQLSRVNPDELNKIYNGFSNALGMIITLGIQNIKKYKGDNDEIANLERVRRIVNLAPNDEKLLRSKEKVWEVRKYIIEKDAEYFLKKDYSKYIRNDWKKEFITEVLLTVRNYYAVSNKEEQELYWKHANSLLYWVSYFKKVTECQE